MEVADRWKDEVKACPAHKPGEKKGKKRPGSQAVQHLILGGRNQNDAAVLKIQQL